MCHLGLLHGKFEALEMRDGDNSRYQGNGVLRAVDNVNNVIAKSIIGNNIFEQTKIDEIMINLDGTEDKSKFGANAILGVSMAVADCAAKSLRSTTLYVFRRDFW